MTNPIGAFFTPLCWAKWVVEKNGLFDRWLEGAVVLDPTAGEGSFLESFISIAAEKRITVRKGMLRRLVGIEKEKKFVDNFFRKMEHTYGLSFPAENFRNEDFILSGNTPKADILLGNPPWQNFSDLPSRYKGVLKPYFFRYHLVANAKDLLLGGSRIDIAALILAKSLIENLNTRGSAYFFLPLSILLNDSAHKAFRSYKLGTANFAVKEVFDFNDTQIFEGITARYGVAIFQRDITQSFPIPYHVFTPNGWDRKSAMPAFAPDDPLSIVDDSADARTPFAAFKKISIEAGSKPRQGVNTCGANDVFIFDSFSRLNETMARVGNKVNRDIDLPLKYLFPLVVKENFHEAHATSKRFVLLPYNAVTARPLEKFEIAEEVALHKYLTTRKSVLQRRKGTLINGWIKKGYWWALLGIGKYSFAPHKIFWEAYGRDTFVPRIFSAENGFSWQGNQSLHAYIPCENLSVADEIRTHLLNPFIQQYLSSQRMGGTCNWAQPGRVSKLLEFTNG